MLEGNAFPMVNASDFAIDLESSHRIVSGLTQALQRNFKQDMHYNRPLPSPQINIMFAFDKDLASSMIAYMTAKLQETGLAPNEFRFTRKCGLEGDVLQRLRLEFPQGINAHMLRKLLIATDRLERILPPYRP